MRQFFAPLILGSTILQGLFMSVSANEANPPIYKGTETLAYEVVQKLGEDIEIRAYAPAVKVSAVADGENNAFGQLFRYISGANSVNKDIAMTSPVETSSASAKIAMTTPVEMTMNSQKNMQMSFFLPSMYNYNTAPKPTGPGVTLTEVPAKLVGVIRFSGLRGESKVTEKTTQLRESLENANYQIISEPVMMGYDAPWTLWFKRRNEVMFEVVSPAS
ncbi:MAG: SOUL family heme-binding protein [Glaciecola sp.]|jgi:hypothetical protein